MSRYFWPILTPLPLVTLCHTSRDPPKVRHTSRDFIRPSTKNPDKIPLYKFSLNCSRGFLSRGFVFLSGRFSPGCFLSVPPLIRMQVLQQKIKHHLKFHVSY